MATTPEQLSRILARLEDCNLEFKKAAHTFDSRELRDYCSALANERGGKLLLGVRQKPDNKGEAAGTTVYLGTHNKISHDLLKELGIRVDIEEVFHTGKRILVFHIPSRPVGSVVRSTGHYKIPMRAGESLQEMDDQTLKTIMNETMPDFTALPVTELSASDMDPTAIANLRRLCSNHLKNANYSTCSEQQLLVDLGLIHNGAINYAGLILVGTKSAIDRLLPQAEIIFEWRQIPGKIAHDFRKSWRQPFLTIVDEIWRELESRNSRTPFQEGFIQREVFAFEERSIREAVLNAVTHRDYTISGQVVFITASPDGFLIESPGGFLPGITPENAVFNRAWRNQRLAEVFEKAGLVERSGQGLDLIFTASIRMGKGKPDLSKSDSLAVRLFISAQVKDSKFIQFLERVVNERQINLSSEEIINLEKIRSSEEIPNHGFIKKFLDLGLIEKHGRTRDARYILSHQYYSHIGEKGIHTRLSKLTREKYKQMILDHLARNKRGYAHEFKDAFQELSSSTINNILRELREDGLVTFFGPQRTGFWQVASSETTQNNNNNTNKRP